MDVQQDAAFEPELGVHQAVGIAEAVTISSFQVVHFRQIQVLGHEGIDGGKEQAAEAVRALLLGEGVQPACHYALHVNLSAGLAAEEGIDGDAEGVGDGGQKGDVRRAAALPAARRLGADPHGSAQLLLGKARGLAETGDVVAQRVVFHRLASLLRLLGQL